MQDTLNSMVATEPFVFAKGGITVAPEQFALLHRVAGVAKTFAGVTVEVQGYTDSEGDPGRNLTLSEQRAKAVADALIAVGVPSANITSKGFGETGLITDDNGVEIPEKSRRVVFGVTLSN
jgi:outer membrane protein OmpA-like peptidoglycan-associated protein